MSRFLSTNQILPWQYLLVQPAVTCPLVAASFLPSAGIVFHTYPLPIENQKGVKEKSGVKLEKSFPSRLSYLVPLIVGLYITFVAVETKNAFCFLASSILLKLYRKKIN
jgi:hypothetical protein